MTVPPEDSGALADAIGALAADPGRRAEMGQAGRIFVEQFYDRAALAREYRKILDQADASLGSDPAGRAPDGRSRHRKRGGQ